MEFHCNFIEKTDGNGISEEDPAVRIIIVSLNETDLTQEAFMETMVTLSPSDISYLLDIPTKNDSQRTYLLAKFSISFLLLAGQKSYQIPWMRVMFALREQQRMHQKQKATGQQSEKSNKKLCLNQENSQICN